VAQSHKFIAQTTERAETNNDQKRVAMRIFRPIGFSIFV
jgi:hypothetical protein